MIRKLPAIGQSQSSQNSTEHASNKKGCRVHQLNTAANSSTPYSQNRAELLEKLKNDIRSGNYDFNIRQLALDLITDDREPLV